MANASVERVPPKIIILSTVSLLERLKKLKSISVIGHQGVRGK